MKAFLLITLVFFSVDLHPFSSVTGFIDQKDWNVHARITNQALKPFGFSYISFKHIMAGNVSHDFYQSNILKADHHCDRNKGVTNVKAAQACKKRAYEFLKRAEEYMEHGKILKGLHFFGRSLHIFQDFVSHSNFVDLGKKEKQMAMDFILNKSKKVPNSLKITGWDHNIKKGEKPGELKGDFYPHDIYCKDHPKKSPEANKKANGYKDMTKFEASFQEAVTITAAITTLLKSRLKKNVWEIVQLSKHFN